MQRDSTEQVRRRRELERNLGELQRRCGRNALRFGNGRALPDCRRKALPRWMRERTKGIHAHRLFVPELGHEVTVEAFGFCGEILEHGLGGWDYDDHEEEFEDAVEAVEAAYERARMWGRRATGRRSIIVRRVLPLRPVGRIRRGPRRQRRNSRCRSPGSRPADDDPLPRSTAAPERAER